MTDLQDITLDINETSDLISLPFSYDKLWKVSVDGIGLRIVSAGAGDLVGQDIGSFTYRAFNSGAELGPDSFITSLGGGFGVFPLYNQYFRVGTVVVPGSKYRMVIDSLPVEYTAVDGDTNIDVINNLVNLVNSTSYSFPVTAYYSTFLYPNVRIETIGPQTVEVSLTAGNFWMSKSGLYYAYQGEYYIISETRVESSTIPSLPAVSGPYDFEAMTSIGSDFLGYLFESEFPSISTYDFVGFYGIATVENVPDTQIALESSDVLPLTGFILKFGTSFNLGFVQKLTIIYS